MGERLRALALDVARSGLLCCVVLSGCRSAKQVPPWLAEADTASANAQSQRAVAGSAQGGSVTGQAAAAQGGAASGSMRQASQAGQSQAGQSQAGQSQAGALAAAAASGGAMLSDAGSTPDPEATAEARDPGTPPEVAQHASDWPLPNRDYDNTRVAKTAIDSRTVGMLREAWRYQLKIDATAFGFYTANTLILGDTLYLQDMMSNVYALSRSSGQVLWSRMFNEATFGPNGVAIGWGKLFAAVGDSAVVAIALDGGADVWKLAPELGTSMGMDIQPIVHSGQLYAATVPVSTSRGVYEGGTHGKLLAVDAETGVLRWSFDTIDSPDAWGASTVNGGGGAWYPPLIDAQRGVTIWGTGNPVPWPGSADKPNGASRPGPNLYTSSMVALGTEDGKLRWYYQDQPHDIFDWDFQITPVRVRAAAQSGGDIVIGAGKTGRLAAVDADSGKLLWRTKVGKHENDELTEYPTQSITIFPGVLGGVMSALAYADGVVYAASVDASMSYDGNLLVPEVGGTGALTAIKVSDGSVLWTSPLKGAGYGSATVANDLVLTADETGRVYAFARDTGEEVWHYDAPAGINAPLVVAGDDLLIAVGMDRGVIIALNLHAPDKPVDMGMAGSMAPPAAGSGGSADAGPGDPTWTAVYHDILQRSCNGPSCHGSMVAGQLKMATAAEAYSALVGVAAMGGAGSGVACSSTGLMRVAPSDPDNSLIVQKVESAMPLCGQHMPPGGNLTAAQIQQLRMWIAAGAANN